MKQLLILTLAMVLSSLILLSCAPNTTAKQSLEILVSGLQQPEEKTFFRTFVKLFEAETNAEVNLVYLSPDELLSRVQSEQTSGLIETDVIMIDTAHTSPFLSESWMASIDWLDQQSDRTIVDLFDAYTHQEGVRYFAPVSWDVYVTIYNKLALPYLPSSVVVRRDESNQLVSIESITWEDYFAWAIAIKQGFGEAKAGFAMAEQNSQLLYAFGGMALAYGADSFPLIEDTSAILAWNALANAAHEGAFVSQSLLSASNQPTALLDNGTLWMAFGHMGPIGAAYVKNAGAYVLGPAPKAEATGSSGSLAGAWTYGILNDAPHAEIAKKWLLFMTEPEINYLYCSGLGGVISPIAETIAQLGSSHSDQIMKIGLSMRDSSLFIQVLDTSTHSPWNDVRDIYLELAIRLWSGVPLTTMEIASFQERLDEIKT